MKKQYFVLLLLVIISNSLFPFTKKSQPLAVTVTNIVPVTCNGACDGSADVTFTGAGTGPYTIQWLGGTNPTFTNVAASPFTCTGLCGGNYTVRVTGTLMTQIANIVISEPAPIAMFIDTQMDVTCYGLNNGSANVSVAGGTLPYASQTWLLPVTLNPNPDQTGNGLWPGNNTYQVIDAAGCMASLSVSINEPDSIQIAVNTIPSICGLCNGSAGVIVTGGTPPYLYNWSGGGQITSSVYNLCMGIYMIQVMDANGCIKSQMVSIADLPPPTIDSIQIQNASCNGFGDGSATVFPRAGGSVNLTYQWYNSSNISIGNGIYQGALSNGIYQVIVTDANGCYVTSFATINQPNPLQISVDVIEATNIDSCNASATVNVLGGTIPYSYTWATLPSSGQTQNNLCVGSYSVTVTDANNCPAVFQSFDVQVIGLKEIQSLNASVFPNPTNMGSFKIQLNDASYKNLHFTMYNAAGVKVMDKNLASQPVNEITTSGLTNGIYFYQLINADGKKYAGKIVIGN